MKLAGLNALITGASQGLGAVIAYRFVADGASVVLTARSAESLEIVRQSLLPMCAGNQCVVTVPCDVARPEEVDSLVAAAAKMMGGIDIVINNASVFGPIGSLEEITWQGWLDTFNVNLHGTVYTCRAAIPWLKRSKRGKIINISGGGAAQALPSLCAYAASKAAVLRFTEELAEELRASQIDVNAVAPGPLNTRFVDHALAAGPERLGPALYNAIKQIRKSGGTPFNLGANLCAYLASRESDGVTGKLISARYDDWSNLHEQIDSLNSSDMYTMRRIDPHTIQRNSNSADVSLKPVPIVESTVNDVGVPIRHQQARALVVRRRRSAAGQGLQ